MHTFTKTLCCYIRMRDPERKERIGNISGYNTNSANIATQYYNTNIAGIFMKCLRCTEDTAINCMKKAKKTSQKR